MTCSSALGPEAGRASARCSRRAAHRSRPHARHSHGVEHRRDGQLPERKHSPDYLSIRTPWNLGRYQGGGSPSAASGRSRAGRRMSAFVGPILAGERHEPRMALPQDAVVERPAGRSRGPAGPPRRGQLPVPPAGARPAEGARPCARPSSRCWPGRGGSRASCRCRPARPSAGRCTRAWPSTRPPTTPSSAWRSSTPWPMTPT